MNLLVLFSWGARCFLGVQTIREVKFRTFLLWSSNSPCRTNNVREYFTLSIVLDLIRQCSVLTTYGKILLPRVIVFYSLSVCINTMYEKISPQSNFMQFHNVF